MCTPSYKLEGPWTPIACIMLHHLLTPTIPPHPHPHPHHPPCACRQAGVEVEWPIGAARAAGLAPYLDVGNTAAEAEGAAEGAAGGDGDAVGQLVAMAAFVPGDGWVDPTLLAQGYLHGARRHSQTVDLRSNTTAESVISDRGNRRVRGVGLADGAIIECDSVVDVTGMWAGMLQVRCVDGVTHRAGGRSLPMASTRSHYFITQHEPESFPSTMPNVIVPDARFYTRPEAAGAMLIGIQEKDSMSGDARQLGAFADDAAGAGGGVDGGVGARVDSVAAHDAAGASSAQAEELLLEMSGDIERFLADGVLDRYE